MTVASLFAWATDMLLVAARMAMLFIAAPPFAGIPVPALARIVVVVALTAGLVGITPPTSAAVLTPESLISALIYEAVVGGVFAAGLFAAFGAFQFGGRLLDFQVGFGMASLVDIATRNNVPLLGALLSMLASVFFFAIDGHLVLLRLLHLSLEKLPPGGSLLSLNIGALIAQFGTCFSFGMILVAPVVLCLFLVDVGMSFMSRTMPQMNVFVMSVSLKVIVGLAVLAIAVPLAGSVIHRVFESLFHTLYGVLS